MRLFVALPVPAAERERVVAEAEQLRPRLPAARWAPAANLHLTLVFLGDTPRRHLAALGEALGCCFRGFPPLRLRLAIAGCFPPRRPARIAWVGLAPDAGLARLQRAVAETVAATLGRPAERRPFHPHLTLARCRRPWPRPAVELWTAELGGRQGGAFAVTDGALVRSRLGPAGARYESLASYPLLAPATDVV